MSPAAILSLAAVLAVSFRSGSTNKDRSIQIQIYVTQFHQPRNFSMLYDSQNVVTNVMIARSDGAKEI